ncbi:MAG: alpha/beta fold hydrolase [Clostridium sp.]|nr:alpha/beta fold hydrolase [Clostridium sp.]
MMRSIVVIVLIGILICILIIGSFLIIRSSGKSKDFLDSRGNKIENSISEKAYVEINGVRQGMFIKSKDINNPVLLFVHGGPIMPEYFLNDNYPTGLEDYFTICWWEQPGVGLSYNSNISKEDLTVDSIVEDTIEVTNYLRQRFKQEKIYLLGHSWGTFIALQAAYIKPELYNAYIGMGQITNQSKSEKSAYEYMMNKYLQINDKKMYNKLKEYKINESNDELIRYFKSSVRDTAMHELGIGTIHDMSSVFSGIFMPVMNCSEYTITEKINIWRGKSYVKNNTTLINDFLFADMPSKIPELKIPCYFISGIYDYTVSWKLAEEYYEKINAPIKGFYLFNNSAHSPMFEEPNKFIDIMLNDVMKEKSDLTDF